MKTTAPTEYINLKTAAERINVTPRTLKLWIERYNLPMIKTGRSIRINWEAFSESYEKKFSNVA
jgi:excisionase family DNA binding protein